MGLESNQSPRSLPGVEWLSFSGAPSEDVLLFARGVHRCAFAYKRLKDDAWMADYAHGCLLGEALAWFDTIDVEIQLDWLKLRPALMDRFIKNSRVKVVRGNGAVLGYVAPPTSGAHGAITASADQALVLNVSRALDTRKTVTMIRMVGHTNSPFPFIGIESLKDEYWDLRACEEVGPEGTKFHRRARADTTTLAQVASSNVWLIKKPDNSTEELCMEWTEATDARTPLQAVTSSSTTSPKELWMRKVILGGEESVKLILERF
ncbi:hypothetical protein FRB93_009281 [Tulasnella sp. JGI-2019a]|nr:hypothetical protein FRB93_009281 [Tulasnella sp. JGI-2019a]